MQAKEHWLSTEDLHRLLGLIFSVADDVWPATRIKLHQSLVGPVSDELCSSSVLVGLFLQSVELRFEVFNLSFLLLNLGLAFLQVCLDDVVESELIVHVGLGASALAARLQDVNASTLGG